MARRTLFAIADHAVMTTFFVSELFNGLTVRKARTREELFEAVPLFKPDYIILEPSLVTDCTDEFVDLVHSHQVREVRFTEVVEAPWVHRLREVLLPLSPPKPLKPPPVAPARRAVPEVVSQVPMTATLNGARKPRRSDAVILLVDQDEGIRAFVAEMLESEGHQVIQAETGAEARELVREGNIKLIILELYLPDIDGLVLCADLHAQKKNVPIIVLSGSPRQRDPILALKLGASEYISKPFDVDQFLARVTATIRRNERSVSEAKIVPSTSQVSTTTTLLTEGNIVLDKARRRATVGSIEIFLTPTEYRVLATFMERPKEVLSRQDLALSVWGYQDASIGRSIDVHATRLRQKLVQNNSTHTIISVRGFGYRMVPTAESE